MATADSPLLILINTNRMQPPIAPIGLEYLAGAARRAGVRVEIIDLCLAADPERELESGLESSSPELVGLTFRNVDDCFWPRGESFVPLLAETARRVRSLTDAPLVLGGVGFSMFPERLVEAAGADFGVLGDGEEAVVALLRELRGDRRLDGVKGLIWRRGGEIMCNPPAWPEPVSSGAAREGVDNAAYLRLGGQIGVETKRGCPRRCLYCADPLAKGPKTRMRPPREVAMEIESLLARGIDVFHLCDSEFNLPPDHALSVCEEIARRGLGSSIRWYAYLAVTPFDDRLAAAMARAGCAGINFTGDSAAEEMLEMYRQPHREHDIEAAVRSCREHSISVMIDLLLGGPGETPETAAATVDAIRRIDPDCAGAALGIRVYPRTPLARLLEKDGPLDEHPAIRRLYAGPLDLLQPTFFISEHLGSRPSALVRELIGGDPRFFAPAPDPDEAPATPPGGDTSHNYNDNLRLVEAIAAGARGAYWDILRRMDARG
ncbi:MAG: radical SAM protein [Planctomycetes bacterium]|nr:radical SAM protein [Planctomycetota bacterium]